MMAIGISKIGNDYAAQLYDMPASKTVFMAIAFSLAMRAAEDDPEAARRVVWEEWDALHANGIVPQKPPKAKP